jgi:hypothetical protein
MRFTKFIEYRRQSWVPWVNLFAGTAHNPGGAQCPGGQSDTQRWSGQDLRINVE